MAKIPYQENELIKASINGDAEAFEIIVKKYQSYICAITYSATGDIEKSEELAQEAFVKAWQGLSQLKNLSKFKGWLKSITSNVIRGWLRTKKRDIIYKSTPIDQMDDAGSNESEPVRIAIQEEQRQVVRDALSQIPPKYREPLVLFYRQKQSINELAQQLEISEEAARTRLHRGRQYLREQVAAMVETTISETGPGKAFTTAVIGSIAALSLKSGSTATAANIAAHSATGAGKIAAITTFVGSTTGKIASIAAVIVIGITLIMTNLPENKLPAEPNLPIITNPQTNNIARPEGNPNTDTTLINQEPDTQNNTIENAYQSIVDSNNTIPIETAETITDEYQFQPKGAISGLITDIETGAPVVDILVEIDARTMGRFFSTRTDEHGFYFFENIEAPEQIDFFIRSLDYVGYYKNVDTPPRIELIQGMPAVKHFQLPRACKIDVFVYDEDGNPIKDAEASTSLEGASASYPRSCMKKSSDENGYILVGGIKPSEEDYILKVTHHTTREEVYSDGKVHNMTIYDYAFAGKNIKLNNPDVIEKVEIVLEKGIQVEGYIEYADGIPATNFEVRAQPSRVKALPFANNFKVDESGYFTLDHIVPAAYDISVEVNKSGFINEIYSQKEIYLPKINNELFVITLPEKYDPDGALNGTFTIPDLDGPCILKINAVSEELDFYTDSVIVNQDTTKYSFNINDIKSGEYTVCFRGGNYYKEIQNVKVPGELLDVEIPKLQKPVLEAVVLDYNTNKPITNYRIRAKVIRNFNLINSGQTEKWLIINNENGKSEISTQGPGLYRLQVMAENYAPQWSQEINTDLSLNTVIKLQQGGIIQGHIIDEQGNPVSDAIISPLSKAQGTTTSTSYQFSSLEGSTQSINGTFILENIPAGLETLKVTHPSYALAIVRDIPIANDKVTDNIEIVLNKGAAVAGYVYDEYGNPAPNVTLEINNSAFLSDLDYIMRGVKESIVITDSNGFYSLSGLPESRCGVVRENEWRTLGVVRRYGFLSNNETTILNLGGKQFLTGTIIKNNQPFADKKILLSDIEAPDYGFFYCYAQTDSLGRFTFQGVLPGKYYMYDSPNGSINDWIEITQVEISNQDANIGIILYDSNIKSPEDY